MHFVMRLLIAKPNSNLKFKLHNKLINIHRVGPDIVNNDLLLICIDKLLQKNNHQADLYEWKIIQ